MPTPRRPPCLKTALGGPADVVLTDMAAPTTGHRATDHIRTIALLEVALEVAEDVLRPGGVFVGKVFQGGATGELLARMKKSFTTVKHVKPPASRAESVELYLVALDSDGFRRAERAETMRVVVEKYERVVVFRRGFGLECGVCVKWGSGRVSRN